MQDVRKEGEIRNVAVAYVCLEWVVREGLQRGGQIGKAHLMPCGLYLVSSFAKSPRLLALNVENTGFRFRTTLYACAVGASGA